MSNKKKKNILYVLIAIAIIILISVGSTFAYFSASINSAENAVNVTAAIFKLDLDDDTDLIKSHVIPSAEKYVDMAINRRDASGNLLKPYKQINSETNQEETITRGTTCIDDNLNEICSVYTFTIINPMTNNDVPLYVTLDTTMNNFENLYYKVIDAEGNEVISATRLIDDRYQTGADGAFLKDAEGKLIPKDNFDELTISPTVLTGINKKLAKAVDENTPSTVTYSIVMWIMETNKPQNTSDGGKIFAATLNVTASGADGGGITGVISASGTE